MHIIIEDAGSLQYLTGDGRWVKNATEGKSYTGTKIAFRVAKQEPIGKFNIVGFIRATKQFINLDHGQGKGAVPGVAIPG